MNIKRVRKSELPAVIAELNTKPMLVFDTETTGLRAFHDSNIFSLAISDMDGNAYYFNFKEYKDLDPDFVLTFDDVKPIMVHGRTWIAHNAKFDLHFTHKAGIRPKGTYHDTEVLARLFENHHQFKSGGYSLASCAERWLSVRKDDRVKTWMDENGAYTNYPNAEGRDTKHYYFDLVPFDLISEYAAIDAIVTGDLYKFLTDELYETKCVTVESEMIAVLWKMESDGVKLDRAYCDKAYNYEQARVVAAEEKLKAICAGNFTDSAKFLAPLLNGRGFVLPLTEKGNPQVTDDVLRQREDNLAALVLELRDAQKRATTYWSGYKFLADKDDLIHTNFRQSGTVTGRMSCNNPNLQNIPAEDQGLFPVRRAFIPRPKHYFVSIDYAQMEFRLMLEYAQETELIEKIKAGLDPHDSTAELTGLSRKAAKTLNFGLLYGMGVAKLAAGIGVSIEEAKQFKYRYFDALPGVKGFIRESSRRMELRGYTFNWAGRRYILEDPKWSYKAANSIIQGGCADICKTAMVRLSSLLRPYRTRMVLQVHDEILFEVPDYELHLVPELKRTMEQAFTAKYMPMACSVAWSKKNFHDMVELKEGEKIP